MHTNEKEYASVEKDNAGVLRYVPYDLPLFDGFPYLSTRLSPAFYHITLLPQDKPETFLWTLAASQTYLNCLRACLVLDYASCHYFDENGRSTSSKEPPRGRTVAFGKLRPFREFVITTDWATRRDNLRNFAGNPQTYLLGDLTKGGHSATPEEARRLAGKQEDGVPVGLVRCPRCSQWKGGCLDPSPNFENQVMTVHCLCDNNNLCAGCGHWLHDRKLNANYFNEADGMIWHVPGFCAFGHQCAEVLQ
jgi:hypothetical protein